MEEEIQLIPQIIEVVINDDGKTASEIYSFSDKGKKWKIQEIMLGMESNRKAVAYDGHLKALAECRAEILENGKLRII